MNARLNPLIEWLLNREKGYQPLCVVPLLMCRSSANCVAPKALDYGGEARAV